VEDLDMVINLPPDLEATVDETAKRQGVTSESLVLSVLRQHLASAMRIQPQDEWERRLLAIATDCGVSLSNLDVSSEGLCD
jgi:hypothetical protein